MSTQSIDNHIGDSGAVALAEALKVNKTLTELSVCGQSEESKYKSIVTQMII